MTRIRKILAGVAMGLTLVPTADAGRLAPETENLVEWCENSVAVLRQTLNHSLLLESDEQEVQLLVSTVESELRRSTHRYEKYFRYTLQSALTDYLVIYPTDVSRQAAFLRYAIEESIHDLKFLSDYWRGEDDCNCREGDRRRNRHYHDTRAYVLTLFARARTLGMTTPNTSEEIRILTDTLERSKAWLEVSDYAREPSYACAYQIIEETLKNAALPSLTPKRVVAFLRSGLTRAEWRLSRGC